MSRNSPAPSLSVTGTYRHGGQARPSMFGGRVLANVESIERDGEQPSDEETS
jgi:hypothetical protein